MNSYKYWLLEHFDLIDDIKSVIKYYAKRRIIMPPNYDLLKENNINTYVYDHIIYNVSDTKLFFNTPHSYTQSIFFVENKKIINIQFAYFIEGTLFDSDCDVDFTQSNINNVYLYKYDNLTFCNNEWEFVNMDNIEQDGCYSILGDVIYIVE